MFNNDFSFPINSFHCTQFLYANSVETTSSTKRRNSEIFLTLIYSRNLQNASNKDINTTNYRKYQFIDEATIFPVSTIIIKLGSIAKKYEPKTIVCLQHQLSTKKIECKNISPTRDSNPQP